MEVTTVSESVGMLQKLNALASIAIFQCLPMLYEFRFALFLCPQIERIASGSAVSKPRAFMRQMSSSLGSVSFHHLGLSKADLKDFAGEDALVASHAGRRRVTRRTPRTRSVGRRAAATTRTVGGRGGRGGAEELTQFATGRALSRSGR